MITCKEFYITMRHLNAIDVIFEAPVFCFEDIPILFSYSEENYVDIRILGDLENQLISIRKGETKKIHSIKDLVTFVTLIKCSDNKKSINEIVGKIYEYLSSDISSLNTLVPVSTRYSKVYKLCKIFNFTFPFKFKLTKPEKLQGLCKFLNINIPCNRIQSDKMQELFDLLKIFDSFVNPFSNKNLEIKQVSTIDKVEIHFADTPILSLSNQSVKSKLFYTSQVDWSYQCFIEKENEFFLTMVHYYHHNKDETVFLNFSSSSGSPIIDLRLSTSTGLVYETYQEYKATFATKKQINMINNYLKVCIKELFNNVILHMI